jgi:hypothetical protein
LQVIEYKQLIASIGSRCNNSLPDPAANEFGAIRKVILVIAEKIRSEIPPADIAEVMEQVDGLLDKSVSTELCHPTVGNCAKLH